MKKIFLIYLLALSCLGGFAQDSIFYRHRKAITAKVIEVSDNFIRYRRFDNPDGPIYNVQKAEISRIKYENGTTDNFSGFIRRPQPPQRNLRMEDPERFKPAGDHMISTGLWVFGSFLESYLDAEKLNQEPIIASYINFEKSFVRNKLAVSIMPFIGYNRKAYGSALGFKVSPRPHLRVPSHFGIQYTLAIQDYMQAKYDYQNYYYISEKYQTAISYLMFNFGFKINLSPQWAVTNDFSLGAMVKNSNFKTYNSTYYTNDHVMASPIPSLRMGLAYRFK